MNKFIRQLTQKIDPVDFVGMLTIINKDGRKQQLEPTEEQIEILQALEEGKDTIILKPRQIGSSTIIVAYLFALAYFSEEPVTFAILSYKLNSSKHLLHIAKNFYNFLPKKLKRELAVDNSTELSFKNGGRLLAVASSQKGGLRSFTASKIMLSEYAFSEEPEELKATAMAAVNGGQLIMESTANYFNDCLHQEIIKTQNGEADYNFLFFKWSKHEEYAIELEPQENFVLTTEEEVIQLEHDLELEQLKWRREKVSKIGWEKFIREYPLDIDEAYRISGNTYFSYSDFENLNIISVDLKDWVTLEEPQENHSYAVGVDIGGGVGRDYSVIYVLSKNTGCPVCIFRSNKVSPIELAQYIQTAATQYNNALVLIEANNFGLATINELGHLGYNRIWKDNNGKDFLTTSKSKPLIFENLKKNLQQGKLTMLDSITATELRTIQVDEKGIIKFSDLLDSHSDSAMALALCSWALNDVKVKEAAYLPKWIINERARKTKTKQADYRRY